MKAMKNSRKGLSPLLAIIIGLIVTIVAGILLAQLYFSYAATISARPAANIEYVDLIEAGDSDILTLNVKNTGNVPINGTYITDSGISGATCTVSGAINQTAGVQPGATFSITCTGSFTDGAGKSWSGTLRVTFTDGSSQVYGIAVKSRIA